MGSKKPRDSTRPRKARSGKSIPKPRRKPARPDLDEILFAFAEAHAQLSVASDVIGRNESVGPERVVLRLGVEASNRVYNQLDMAIVQLDQAHKAGGAS